METARASTGDKATIRSRSLGSPGPSVGRPLFAVQGTTCRSGDTSLRRHWTRGSGGGIVSFGRLEDLEPAAGAGDPWLGLDNTALVQEQLSPQGDAVVRVEILDGQPLYVIRLSLTPGTFNLCPADYSRPDADGVSGRGVPVEGFEAPADLVEQAGGCAAARSFRDHRLDVGLTGKEMHEQQLGGKLHGLIRRFRELAPELILERVCRRIRVLDEPVVQVVNYRQTPSRPPWGE